MKLRYAILAIAVLFAFDISAKESKKTKDAKESKQQTSEVAAAKDTSKKEIVKKGYNFGPLPAVAFDADKGFQLGALLNIYDFGDG
ncbi:MAG: hypothetical protein IIV10_00955, partial [Alistipes sp.]|nr:hypothetical protein [Alistipes sp.]